MKWPFKNKTVNDTEDQWSVFETNNADEPMILRINQTAKKWAGKNAFDIRVGFAIPLNNPAPNGYPSASENKILNKIEDRIYSLVMAKDAGIHAFSITTGHFKEIVFYFNNADVVESIHAEVNAKIKSHEIQCYAEQDSEWSVYFSFLNN